MSGLAVPVLYEHMYRSRRFDQMAVALQRQGAIAGFAEARGQEGGQIGIATCLEPDDLVFPSYRQAGLALLRGVPALDLLRFHRREALCTWDWRRHGFAPYTVPVGSQLAHACGWALGQRWQGTRRIAVVFYGDGASSQGEVHEALNYASVFDAPVLFVCENNGWAISMPVARQTRAARLSDRAVGYGMAGVTLDGGDAVTITTTVAEMVDEIRRSGRPMLLECTSYRQGGHTTSDDPSRYRRGDHPPPADPVTDLRGRLLADGADVTATEQAIDAELSAIVAAFLEEVHSGGHQS